MALLAHHECVWAVCLVDDMLAFAPPLDYRPWLLPFCHSCWPLRLLLLQLLVLIELGARRR